MIRAGRMLATATDGVRRSRAGTSGWPSRSISSWSITVRLAGLRASACGARDEVMTIWSLSMGYAGMVILLLTTLPSQRDRRPF